MSDYRWRRERDHFRTGEDRERDSSGAYESRGSGSQDFRRHAGDRSSLDYERGRDFGRSERARGGGRDFGGRGDWSGGRDYDYERSIDRSGPGDYSESLRYGRQTGFDEYPSRANYPREERDEWQDYARRSGGWGRYDWARGGDEAAHADRWARGDERRDRGEDRGILDRAADEVSSWFGDQDAEQRRERDARRGRGPRGYTRSDERIREDVCDRLTDDHVVDASEVEVAVSGAEVTLSGTVDSREERRRAEDIAERVTGVGHVQNNLRVKGRGDQGSRGDQSGRGTGTSPVSGSSLSQTGGAVGGDAEKSSLGRRTA